MASGSRILQAYEKTSSLNVVVESYPSVVRFIGHVQLKGSRLRTVEAYRMMLWLLARHAGQDPAALDEEAGMRAFGIGCGPERWSCGFLTKQPWSVPAADRS